tara:strand:- start:125 stop:334 length:210 start_codon:yes stop_codon:yes gene_type:complete
MSKQNIEMKLQPVGLIEIAFQVLMLLKQGRITLQISTDIDTDNISTSLNEISNSLDQLTSQVEKIANKE